MAIVKVVFTDSDDGGMDVSMEFEPPFNMRDDGARATLAQLTAWRLAAQLAEEVSAL